MGQAFFSGQLAKLYFLTEADIQLTWQVFSQCLDKEWSFTHSSSKVIIEKLQISKAAQKHGRCDRLSATVIYSYSGLIKKRFSDGDATRSQ